MSGFAGTLRERVTISRRSAARDAIGASAGTWIEIGQVWLSATPAGTGPIEAGGARSALPLWRMTMRERDLAVGDRIARVDGDVIVRSVTRDPASPDRLIAIGEEMR